MDENGTYQQTPVQTPPPPPVHTAAPAMPAPAPKKKRRGCLIAVLVVVALLVVAVAAVALVLGNAGRQKDLGVTYSEADFASAVEKTGVVWPEPPAEGDIDDYERVYSGEKPLDATLTEAELSALMSYNHSASYWPIKNMQVNLSPGGAGEASALVSYMGRDWPVYVAGAAAASNSRLEVSFSSAQVAGMSVPSQYLPLGADFLEGVVNGRLARIPGLRIDAAEVTDEGIHVSGTIWETAEYVKIK